MKIFLVDDHPLVRAGIRSTLERCSEFECVGEAASGDEALPMLAAVTPDLMILDLDMPGMAAPELARLARELHPHMRLLILSAHDDEKMLRTIRGTPVSGYILKDEAPENLAQALRVIQQGAVWFSQSVAQKMLGMVAQPDPLQALTGRERQILQRIVQGLDNQAIATDLNLAEQTVRNYASTLYEKLGVSSRMEAVVWARENNVVR